MDPAADAAELLAGRPILALTGAGISTDSGIPDYRGPGSPRRRPMMFAEFRSSADARSRYWARSHLGWRRVAAAQPNPGHYAIADLERRSALCGLITQNVDGLHTKAGSSGVIELHGRLADVVCLDCGERTGRARMHRRLAALNPGFAERAPDAAAPDGDADLAAVDGFRVAPCEWCGGVLKPDVVFFGEAVPSDRVARCYALVDSAGALLVAGSSLAVLSGLRFVRHAHARGMPIVVVNRGPTRADELTTLKIDAGCSDVLPALGARLASAATAREVRPAPRNSGAEGPASLAGRAG
ncbi:MAG: NAD-dependent protein deacetylase [Actinomycetota bacterium]